MGMFEDYERFYREYTEKYGNQTVVLYHNGSFHEVYGLDNDTEQVGNVSEIAAFLGIKETRTATKILENSRKNPQMTGFNSVSLDERVEKLVNGGYTVVVVNQVPGTDPIIREMAYVESPSTRNNNIGPRDPYLVSIYFDRSWNRSSSQFYSYIGMAAIDASTGVSTFYESNSTISDPTLAEDDLTRFLQSFNPVEVVLMCGPGSGSGLDLSDMVRTWGFRLKNDDIGHRPTVFIDTESHKTVSKIPYQEEFLAGYFPNRGHLDPSEYLGMTRYDAARIAYIHLLDFCSNHNRRLLTSMAEPTLWNTGNVLVLDTRSIVQLNVIESYYDQQRQDSVVAMLTRYTHTGMGRRLLRDRLINPIADNIELATRYRMIETAVGSVGAPSGVVGGAPPHDEFRKIRDIDRLNRKIARGILTPAELHILDRSLDVAYRHNETMSGDNRDFREIHHVLSGIEAVRAIYLDILDIEEAGKCTVTEKMQDSIFKLGYNSEIDELSAKIRKINRTRDILCQRLSNLIAPGQCKYKVDLKGTSCYCVVTKAQYRKLQSNFPDPLSCTVDGTELTISWADLKLDNRNKSNVKFTLSILDDLQEQQNTSLSDLRQLSQRLYNALLTELRGSIGSKLQKIASAIGELDLYYGMAKAATCNNHCKPEPVADNGSGSHLSAVRLRHPMVERKHMYVPQTIQLGQQYEQRGMLLYGVNQTGKSCTMKSVGIAVIMAQAGLFVPAEQFRFCPYKLLSTRILSLDNIAAGLSTYAVEMIELRSILTRCNKNSLSLGDEVCHGTESASAVSLVAASIEHMSKKKSCFIFATHLHDLSKITEVTEIEEVKHYHLTVDFDGDRIVYNRMMLPGAGLGLYGIEVAKHLKLPLGVLENAYKIRNKYFMAEGAKDGAEGGLAQMKPSRYNQKVIVSKCRIPGCSEQATQTHHIRHQAAGESTDGMHMNNPDNLVPICDRHHDLTHGKGGGHGILVIFGYGADGHLECSERRKLDSLL
jgi:DNA mismatch repair protein MutS